MDELIGWVIGIVLVIAVIYFVIVYILLPLLVLVGGIGALIGGGVSISNYFKAFSENVYIEQPVK